MSALGELAALTTRDGDLEDTAEAVVALAMNTVECDFAGLTVFAGKNRLVTLAPSDPIVEQADQLQYDLQEGPCVMAAWEEDTFVSNDLSCDARWPNWGPKATALGMSSLLATRLANGDRTIGALNLYSTQRREFTTEDRDFARVFASHAGSIILTARELQNLRVALDARTLIGQAQGILMERFQIDAARSFSLLRRYSQAKNLKLRRVAEGVIASRELPPTRVGERADGDPDAVRFNAGA